MDGEMDFQPAPALSPGFLSDLCQTILLPCALFQSSPYWQLVFHHSVPRCFSIWACHASTQVACFQSAPTFYIHVYLKRSVLGNAAYIWEEAPEWGWCWLQAAGLGKLWQFEEGADRCPDFIIHSQLSSACSAVPGTAPPRQAGYVKELPGIGGV